jgi:hypothetical protein
MTDLHARLVEEIKRRIAVARASMTECPAYAAEAQRDDELSVTLRIAELHAPGHKEMCQTCCPFCTHADWPCDTAKALLDAFCAGWRE